MPRRKAPRGPLDDPISRQKIGREIARAAASEDILTPWSRDMRILVKNVLLTIPLRDPVEVRRALAMIEEVCHDLRLQLTQKGTDQSHLILVRGTLRMLNQKINAYRKPAQD